MEFGINLTYIARFLILLIVQTKLPIYALLLNPLILSVKFSIPSTNSFASMYYLFMVHISFNGMSCMDMYDHITAEYYNYILTP
jgi:hypothetical protein